MDITKKERAVLEKFKENVKDTVKPASFDDDDDIYFTRWLIARNFDLEKAEVMLRKSLAYRKSQQADTILETYSSPEVLNKYYVGGMCGYDKEGSPIWLDPFARLDSKGILHSVTKAQLINHKLHTCEQLLRLCQQQTIKKNKPVSQVVIIFDLEGLGWKNLWKPGIDAFSEVIAQFEDNYPELLKKTYIINAPKLFVLGYNMIKPVISQRTAAKVHVLGKHWIDVLLKDIDADQLPKYYGGNMVDDDGDERCSSKILYGGEVPQKYYFTNEDIATDLQCITVARGSVHRLEFDISVEECKLSYVVKTDKHDIAFGILYRPADSQVKCPKHVEIIIPVKRMNTHMIHQTGLVECSKRGTYILVFDNSFSWTKSKKVGYSVEILSPDDGESFSSALEVCNDDEPVTDFA